MFHVEAKAMIDEVFRDLYPGWNPTATQLEGLVHKLADFRREDVRAAMMVTYEPGLRVAPVAGMLAECRRIVAARKAEERAAEAKSAEVQSADVFTPEAMDALYRRRAQQGDRFAAEMCRRRGIEINA